MLYVPVQDWGDWDITIFGLRNVYAITRKAGPNRVEDSGGGFLPVVNHMEWIR